MVNAIEIVRRALKEKKMTQTELAKTLGERPQIINQQLNQQKDLKVERFIEVMEHIGYRVEIVDNNGIRKVSADVIEDIQAGTVVGNMFYVEARDGTILGFYSNGETYAVEEFGTKAECFDWLISLHKHLEDSNTQTENS